MPVSERLMEVGQWELRFIEDTPPSLIDMISDVDEYLFAHIVITPVHLEGILNDTLVLPRARYTGIIRSILEGGLELNGPGLAAWLGDEDGKGPVYESLVELEDGTFSQWMEALVPDTMPVRRGTITNPPNGDTLTWETIYTTPREALDLVSRFFGTEWRIHPDATIDAGPESDIFVSDPEVVVTPQPGGTEAGFRGLETKRMDVDFDTEEYASRIVELTRAFEFDVAIGEADKAAVPYVDFYGEQVQITKLIDAYQFLGEIVAQHLADQDIKTTNVNRRIGLDASAYAIPQHAAVGDTIFVYDPVRGIIDDSNQIFYRGDLLFPEKLRIFAYTWPIERGMGVYIRRHSNGEIVWQDVTQWVEWEEDVTGVEPDRARKIKKPTIEELYPDLF